MVKFRKLALLVLWSLGLFLSACGGPKSTVKIVHVPLGPSKVTLPKRKGPQKPYTIQGRTYYPLSSAEGYVEEGLASWYGAKFHGRPTASGEPYNMYAFTAAHKILPLGTYVLVTNLENGRRVVVRINDRGPFVPGRIIDLSYAAARALGMVEKGVVRVRIVALAEKGRRPDFRHGEFYLQVGSFTRYANAVKLREKLAQRFPLVTIEPYVQGGKTFYRVRIFLARELEEARRKARKLQKLFPEAFMVAR